MDSPLVLAVLGDGSFQNFILGILQRRICQQQGKFDRTWAGYLPDT